LVGYAEAFGFHFFRNDEPTKAVRHCERQRSATELGGANPEFRLCFSFSIVIFLLLIFIIAEI
jgi:hypothetical protein